MHILSTITFLKKKYAIYEIMCKNTVETDKPQITIWHMCIACCIPKATNTHSEYVILIAFPLQKWLHKCALMLPYTNIACLVCFILYFIFVCLCYTCVFVLAL